jgi:hypothetical protein
MYFVFPDSLVHEDIKERPKRGNQGEIRGMLVTCSHKTGRQEDDGIDNSHDPFISPFPSNTKFLRER